MSPTPKLRIGVAGLGRAFTLMLPTFLHDARIELVAACDPRRAARARFASDFGAAVYDDVPALVADPRVQVLYIATPLPWHATHTRMAAAAGKHVLLEKPMALSLADCEAMIDACRAAQVQLIIGHSHSFDTPYLHARAVVQSGELGRVRMIQALNYTDFLYRPRRAEELSSASGGGVALTQAAHQVEVVRLMATSPAVRLRAVLGQWDAQRPVEGAYSALLWFAEGAFASLSYSGYGHFDSDEWCGGIGEMGQRKNPDAHGSARQRLAALGTPEEEARFKQDGTYGGPRYTPPPAPTPELRHQHFGPLLISCEHGVIRPLPDGLWLLGDTRREHRPLSAPAVPRCEVIDELVAAVQHGQAPLHDGAWARATLEICLALQTSAREQRDVELSLQSTAAA